MTTMTATRLNRWLCMLLVVYLVASCAVQLEESAGGLVRWSGFSVLLPVTAAALLPMRRSLVIGLATLAASIATYGFAIHGVSAGGRTVVITAVALSVALGLVVHRARPNRPTGGTRPARQQSCPEAPPAGQDCGAPGTPHAMTVPPRSILPAALPQPAVVELAGQCVTGSGRLGARAQWLDAIPLSGARVGLVAGAVTGPDATATASELRAAVRTLADVDLQPDELLTHLADVLTRLRPDVRPGREPRTTGTVSAQCLYAVYDPASCSCTVASAGGPRPPSSRPTARSPPSTCPRARRWDRRTCPSRPRRPISPRKPAPAVHSHRHQRAEIRRPRAARRARQAADLPGRHLPVRRQRPGRHS